MKRLFCIGLLFVAAQALARDPRMIPSYDLQSEYVSGGGVVYGNLYMRGNDIYLDADDDSRMELGTDDTVKLYLNSSLVWELDEFGLEATAVAITESENNDRALFINPVLNDTGAPDGTETYVAAQIDITETDKTGWNSVDLLLLSVDTVEVFSIDDAGVLHGANAETLDNSTDGSWRMTGAGGTYNEDLEFDLEGDNLIELKSSTGVTTIDAGAIGLACGTLDASDGNITNVGDVQADSITADGTALQTNAATLTLQQNADAASGNYLAVNSETDAELTASSGAQSFVQIAPEVAQSGTAAYTALEVDATETSVGAGPNYLLDLQVADASKASIDNTGALVCAATGDFGGNLTLDAAGASTNSPYISLKGDSGGTEVEGQIQLMYGADPYIRLSVDDDDSTPAMTGVLDIHDAALSFVSDNTTDIGAAGANRPKNYYGAGDLTLSGGNLTLDTSATAEILIDAATSGWINLNTGAYGPPTFTTRSVGTKFVLYNKVDPDDADYAIGLDSGVIWHSVNKAIDSSAFKWYGGTTLVMTLKGDGELVLASSAELGWSGRSEITSSADGYLTLSNAAATGFTMLRFGGATSSFPAWKRDSAALEARLADDSARAVVKAASLTLDSHVVGIEVEAGAAILGPSAPTWAESTSETVGGLLFDADADEVFIQFEVPNCWDAASDITLKIYWTNAAGAALADTNTVKWDIVYGSIVWGTEAAGNGTEETGTVTYTQSGAGADGDTHISSIALDYDSVNQPITKGDDITLHFDRDVTTDTYASGALVAKWEFEFNSVGICNHY